MFVVFASMASNSSYSGFNSLISIPLKIFFGFILYKYLTNEKVKSKILTNDIVLFCLFIFILFLNVFMTGIIQTDLEVFNRNELASYSMALFYLICIRLITTNRSHYSLLPIAFLLLMLASFFITFSRQAILSLAATLLIYTLLVAKGGTRILISCVFALSLYLSFNFISTSERESQRLETIIKLDPATRADKQRLDNIIFGLSESLDKPIFGHGPQSFIRNSPHNKVAHNSYITTIYEYGIFGLTFLFFIIYKILRPIYLSLFYKSGFIKFIAIFPIGYVMQMLFIETLAKLPIYIFLGSSIMYYNFLRKNHAR